MNSFQEYALFFHEESVLLEKNTNEFILPRETHEQGLTEIYLGEFFHKKIHAIQLPQKFTPSGAFNLVTARELLVTLNEPQLSKLLCRGKQLINWHKSSLFCGHCGHATRVNPEEICKLCDGCNATIYPSTSPAIIVLIQRDNHILLGRSPHFPTGMYSTLAGFVDASESCEEAVMREIHEEVGIHVKNIRYFGSQSWPFPNSFMLGYLADYAEGDIVINPSEIEDAQWFHQDNLPIIPPPYSIARQMIDYFIHNKKK